MIDGHKTAARKYVKVSDDQRSMLIDLMHQNDHVTIRDASDLMNINYESAKAIWTIFKKQGRKHNLKTKKTSSAEMSNDSHSDSSRPILQVFERECERLSQQAREGNARSAGHYLNFSTKLLRHQKHQAKTLKNMNVRCDFFKVVKRLRAADKRTVI